MGILDGLFTNAESKIKEERTKQRRAIRTVERVIDNLTEKSAGLEKERRRHHVEDLQVQDGHESESRAPAAPQQTQSGYHYQRQRYAAGFRFPGFTGDDHECGSRCRADDHG